MFDSPVQTSASQSHLIQLLGLLRRPSDLSSVSPIHKKAIAFLVTSSLLNLAEAYPSQSSYYRNLDASRNLPQSPNDEMVIDCLGWIHSLRSSLNTRNYVQSQRLTDSRRVNSIVDKLVLSEASDNDNAAPLDDLLTKVIYKLIDSLRDKLRESAWQVLRVAYRELTVSVANDVDLANSGWAGRALFFDVVESDSKSLSGLEMWTQQKVSEGQLLEKAGVDGRWVICRNKK